MRILYDPSPRTTAEIFSSVAAQQFFSQHTVIDVSAAQPGERDALYNKHLPEVEVLVSQQPMPLERLQSARCLQAIFNVETNFLPNIDYETCFARGIHVLTPGSVFALPVAEIGLGMALSLARDIHSSHVEFLTASERYGLEGNQRAELLTGSNIGFIGFGDLGRALLGLLQPFNAHIRVFDPWMQAGYLHRQGVQAATLQEVLETSRLVFVVAAITTDNAALLNRDALALMPDQAMLVLLSRAAIADFDALANEARCGRLRIASDVFPAEPVAGDDALRKVPNMLFSAHRAGALVEALQLIGTMVLEDIAQIEQGLPPMSCRAAQRETINRLRSQPIART